MYCFKTESLRAKFGFILPVVVQEENKKAKAICKINISRILKDGCQLGLRTTL
jgi:hypothetical protein